MAKQVRIPGTIEAWESRALGASESHVRAAAPEVEAAIEDALGLKAISIRLPKSTIDAYKALAKLHGVGYQPLMRDAICRWADGELKQMVIGAAQTQPRKAKAPTAEDPGPTLKRAA